MKRVIAVALLAAGLLSGCGGEPRYQGFVSVPEAGRLLALGWTSDPTDGCECIYSPDGRSFWTVNWSDHD